MVGRLSPRGSCRAVPASRPRGPSEAGQQPLSGVRPPGSPTPPQNTGRVPAGASGWRGSGAQRTFTSLVRKGSGGGGALSLKQPLSPGHVCPVRGPERPGVGPCGARAVPTAVHHAPAAGQLHSGRPAAPQPAGQGEERGLGSGPQEPRALQVTGSSQAAQRHRARVSMRLPGILAGGTGKGGHCTGAWGAGTPSLHPGGGVQATPSVPVVRLPWAVFGMGTGGVARRGCVGTLGWVQSSVTLWKVGLRGVFGVRVGLSPPHLQPRCSAVGLCSLCTPRQSPFSRLQVCMALPPPLRARLQGQPPSPTPLACAATVPLCPFWGTGPWWGLSSEQGRQGGAACGWRVSAAWAAISRVTPRPITVAPQGPKQLLWATGQTG